MIFLSVNMRLAWNESEPFNITPSTLAIHLFLMSKNKKQTGVVETDSK